MTKNCFNIFFQQLGHDGLATEAGFPSDDNVEVYDAWYGLPQVQNFGLPLGNNT